MEELVARFKCASVDFAKNQAILEPVMIPHKNDFRVITAINDAIQLAIISAPLSRMIVPGRRYILILQEVSLER